MTISHDREREADAAYFADWSRWRRLDDRPERPVIKRDGQKSVIRQGPRSLTVAASRYYVIPNVRRRVIEISIPNRSPVVDILQSLPGARRDPLTRNGRYDWRGRCYIIPAEHWRTLYAVLPALKQAVATYAAKYDAGAL